MKHAVDIRRMVDDGWWEKETAKDCDGKRGGLDTLDRYRIRQFVRALVGRRVLEVGRAKGDCPGIAAGQAYNTKPTGTQNT